MGLYLRGVASYPSPSALNTLAENFTTKTLTGARVRALLCGYTLTKNRRFSTQPLAPNRKTTFSFLLAQVTH